MAKCSRCRKIILGRGYETHEKIGHTIRFDGSRDTHYKPLVLCLLCRFKEAAKRSARKLGVTPLNAILGALGLVFFAVTVGWFSSDTSAQSRKIVDVIAVAPKASASKPRLILPEDPNAVWHR
jgi:hypothetical protein